MTFSPSVPPSSSTRFCHHAFVGSGAFAPPHTSVGCSGCGSALGHCSDLPPRAVPPSSGCPGAAGGSGGGEALGELLGSGGEAFEGDEDGGGGCDDGGGGTAVAGEVDGEAAGAGPAAQQSSFTPFWLGQQSPTRCAQAGLAEQAAGIVDEALDAAGLA